MKYLVSGAARAAIFGLLWVFFTGADSAYAGYGVVSAAAATAMSLALLPPQGLPRVRRWPHRVWFSARLAVWFVYKSAVGGVDVARRAIPPTPAIEPKVVVAPVRLPEGHALQLAMLMMNLMPGSMIQRGPYRDLDSADEAVEVVEIHTLAESLDPAEQWRQVQLRAGRAFT